MKVFITRPIMDLGKNLLEQHGYEVIVGPDTGSTPELLLDQISKVDGVITMLSDKIDQVLIEKAKNLKVIANYAVGFDNIDLQAASTQNIRVGNTPGVLTEATAECALALLMGVQRQLKASERYIQNQQWKSWHPTDLLGHNLKERKIGIIGMGRIGYEFARICYQAFGSKIFYTHTRRHELADELLQAKQCSLEELFRTCHIVSVHCPLNPSTLHMINKNLFALVPEDFILINTARGQVVKQDDLLHALQTGKVWGAGLDVTDPEPLLPEHPLYQHDRCLILPHLGSATKESREAMAKIAAQNIIAGLAGEQLPCPVN